MTENQKSFIKFLKNAGILTISFGIFIFMRFVAWELDSVPTLGNPILKFLPHALPLPIIVGIFYSRWIYKRSSKDESFNLIKALSILIILLHLLAFISWFGAFTLNNVLDKDEPISRNRYLVIGKNKQWTREGHFCRVTLDTPEAKSKKFELPIPCSDFYNGLQENRDSLDVAVFPGALGLPWVKVLIPE